MARLDIPTGDGGDAVQIWSLQPELGAAATRFVHAAYTKSILPTRVREAARMRMPNSTTAPSASLFVRMP
jgi:hypothetical protein